jgi:hypothetical protein
MTYLISLDTFCSAVRSRGFEVMLSALPATVIAERGSDTVVAEFHDNGSVALTLNGQNVSLAEVVH